MSHFSSNIAVFPAQVRLCMSVDESLVEEETVKKRPHMFKDWNRLNALHLPLMVHTEWEGTADTEVL